MALAILTISHVLISLAGIFYGLVAVTVMTAGRIEKRSNHWFLVTTIATSVTGYFFPVTQVLPSHIVGAISLVVLAVAGVAFWRHALAGAWARRYAITATIALYLNVFVLVVQLFRHIPLLTQLAPTQSEPPFQAAQIVVLLAFITLGTFATRGLRAGPASRTAQTV